MSTNNYKRQIIQIQTTKQGISVNQLMQTDIISSFATSADFKGNIDWKEITKQHREKKES